MATHVLERREQLRPVLKAAVDAEALKRGASLEEVSRLHNELARGAPVLERLIADGLAGRFPAEEVDIRDWKEMLKRAQDLQLKLHQRAARSAAPAMAEERGEESWAPMEALREKREALRQRRIRTRDVATLAQIERELFEVEEQLVSKKIAERLPVSLAAKSATLAALERLEKARKELDEASRELLAALNLQGRCRIGLTLRRDVWAADREPEVRSRESRNERPIRDSGSAQSPTRGYPRKQGPR